MKVRFIASNPASGMLIRRLASAVFLILSAAAILIAQSNDLSQPTPLRTNQIEGRIASRDIGDPRTTEHYYIFSAGSGDLSITVASENLIGDVDLFVAGSFRPLLKIVIFADASAQTSRTLFLRQGENLILRVDARSTDDREGNYRIRFDGGFVPSDLPVTEENAGAQDSSETTAQTNRRGARRTTSVGGRIEEPERDIMETPPPVETPTTAEIPPASPETTATPEASPVEETPRAARTPTPSRRSRPNRRTRGRTTRTRPRPTEERTAPPATNDTTTAAPAPENSLARPETNARLVIETTDGEPIIRLMSNVQRVTVEGGEIIIITTEGETERIPLTRVRRVRIEP